MHLRTDLLSPTAERPDARTFQKVLNKKCQIVSKSVRQCAKASEIVKKCKAKNLSINVWTVNSSIEINNCKELNVDGIITDRYFIKA